MLRLSFNFEGGKCDHFFCHSTRRGYVSLKPLKAGQHMHVGFAIEFIHHSFLHSKRLNSI